MAMLGKAIKAGMSISSCGLHEALLLVLCGLNNYMHQAAIETLKVLLKFISKCSISSSNTVKQC
jgi:hypothetical protein